MIYAAKLNLLIDQRTVIRYWMIAFPAMSIFITSLLYNAISVGKLLAPYPIVLANRYIVLGVCVLLLVCVNIVVETALYRRMNP